VLAGYLSNFQITLEIQLQKLERKPHQSSEVFIILSPLFWLNWNLEMLVLVEGDKLGNAETNAQSKARTDKLNIHMAQG